MVTWKPRWKPVLIGLILIAGTAMALFVRDRAPDRPHRPGAVVAWITDEREAMRVAKEKGLPLLIDFGAEWCEACHDLEERIFTAPRFIEAMKDFVPLRIDVTNDSPENEQKLTKYGVMALPTVAFATSDGRVLDQPRIEGAIPLEDFLATMGKVRASSRSAH